MRLRNLFVSMFLMLLLLLMISLCFSPCLLFAETVSPATQPMQAEGSATNIILLICTIISSVVIPTLTLVAWILLKKGKITKQDKEIVDKIAETMAGGVEAFKSLDKKASKKLTDEISKKASSANVGPELDGYLKKKGINNGTG